jgi:hypothetical protein
VERQIEWEDSGENKDMTVSNHVWHPLVPNADVLIADRTNLKLSLEPSEVFGFV